MSLLTAKLAGLDLTSYHFMISFKAIGLSILFFSVLFFLVHQFNKRELRKMCLLDMLNADRKNDVMPQGKGNGWIMAVFSIILISGGYAAIYMKANENIFKAMGLGGFLLIAGTFMFFTSAFKIAAKLMKSNKRRYFRGLNMFTASQFSSRFKSEGRSVAMIAVLLFLSLTLTIVGPGIGKYVINGIENAAPYDGSISYAAGMPGEQKRSDPLGYLEESGFHIGDYSDAYETFWIYQSPSVTFDLFTAGSALSEHENRIDTYAEEESSTLDIIGVEDFNRLLALQGKEPVQLGEDEYALAYTFPALEKTIEKFLEHPGDIKIGEYTLALAPDGIYHSALENRNILSEFGTVIVPQSMTQKLTQARWCLDFNLRQGTEDIHSALYEGWYEASTNDFNMWAREEAIVSITADNLLTTYLGLYLGITFLITSGAVLAIRQLSQSSDNVSRYILLKKLGASRKDMKHSLMKQLRVYFGLPLFIALIHTSVVIAVVFRLLDGLALSTMVSIIGGSVVLIFTVYAVYFITTYLGSKRILQLR